MSHHDHPAPGFVRDPGHKIEITPSGSRWTASIEGMVLAASRNALILQEADYKPVTYFPRQDICVDQLRETSSKTFCPFKGEASYLADAANKDGPDIAWSYPETFREVTEIEGYVAFYPDRVAVSES
jgi:uncharacterized protein (DUF427 family)